jgi:glycyl-tRNA synthetase
MDIEYEFPYGWKEMFGLAYRTDYDLKNHTKFSGTDLSYKDPVTGESYIPHVIEPTFGLSRLTGIVLIDAYYEDGERVVLKLNPKVAPIKVAVFPLAKNKPEIVEKARKIYKNLKSQGINCVFDDRSSIGKRYLSQDEIGTPWCITIDYATLEDDTVTIRDRDTTKQIRIKTDELMEYFNKKLT